MTERADIYEDAMRWRAMRPLLEGADFRWGDPPRPVIVFSIPPGVRVGMDADRFADDVRGVA